MNVINFGCFSNKIAYHTQEFPGDFFFFTFLDELRYFIHNKNK